MKLKIGLIGAKDSIVIMEQVAREYHEETDVIVAPYEKKEETVELVKKHLDLMDAVIFSGHVPYNIAIENVDIKIPTLYMPHRGTSIYQALWRMQQEGRNLEKVSFDNVSKREVMEIYEDLKISNSHVYVKEYESNLTYQEWADYHKALFNQGKIETVLTCLRETGEILQREGITVYRVLVTRPLARQVIEAAIYEAKGRKLRQNQLAVVVVNIDKFQKEIKKIPSEYGVQKLKLDFQKLLLNYAEETKGAIFSMGSDEYLIFTTGGALEVSTRGFKDSPLMESIRREMKFRASIGVGFGNTAYDAEYNARIGLDYAKESGGDCVFLVDQDHNITGPFGKENQLEYSLGSFDEKILGIAEVTGLSGKNINRIFAMKKKHGSRVTAQDVAYYLQMTDRSARRILSLLEDHGYSVIVGEESEGKGRPKKVYELRI